MTAFATDDRRPADHGRSRAASRRATRRPTPSSCSTQTVGADHLLFILENGNLGHERNFGSNVETALDIEAAHGVATHVGDEVLRLRVRARLRRRAPASRTRGCNGTRRRHARGDGGRRERPDAAQRLEQLGVTAARPSGALADPFAGRDEEHPRARRRGRARRFYFSTGDSGTYESGYPSDSPYVVSVGGTSTYSTSEPGARGARSTTWSGGGSWCSNIIARPVVADRRPASRRTRRAPAA